MKINSFEVMFLVAALLFSVTPFANAGVEIEWLTYLGGTESDGPAHIALDPEGNVYVAGQTYSADFPTTPVTYEIASPTTSCIFVAKLNPTGSQLIYSNVIGNGRVDGLAVDEQGNAYIAGGTHALDFPVTPGAFQTQHGDYYVWDYRLRWDGFVTKISPSGSELIYSTYLGGGPAHSDECWGIAIDAEGNAYVAGKTTSPNFPTTPEAYDKYYDGMGGFVTKINPTGSGLVYSTFLGHWTRCYSIAVDSQGAAYVTGSTAADDFPVTPGAFDTTYNNSHLADAFVTKFNDSGSDLIYSTFLGGDNIDAGYSIAVDEQGNAYVSGEADSSNFPTTPGAYKVPGGNIFVTKLNAWGSDLIYSAIVGSRQWGYMDLRLAVDTAGNAYIVANPFLLKLSASGSQVYDFSYLNVESITGWGPLAVDAGGAIYIAGGTRDPELATSGAFDITHNGEWDVFVAKVHLVEEPIMASELWPFYE